MCGGRQGLMQLVTGHTVMEKPERSKWTTWKLLIIWWAEKAGSRDCGIPLPGDAAKP